MLADYFTKPLQGGLFNKLRQYIMGETIIPAEERVGTNIQKEICDISAWQIRSYAGIVTGKSGNM